MLLVSSLWPYSCKRTLSTYLCSFCNFGVVYRPDVCGCFLFGWHKTQLLAQEGRRCLFFQDIIVKRTNTRRLLCESLYLMNVLPPKPRWSFCWQVEKEQKFIPYVWTVIVSPVFLHKVSCGCIFPLSSSPLSVCRGGTTSTFPGTQSTFVGSIIFLFLLKFCGNQISLLKKCKFHSVSSRT